MAIKRKKGLMAIKRKKVKKSTGLISKFGMNGHGVNLYQMKGAQWLSGRVLDSRPKGSGFEPHRRHCVVVLEQDTFILA